MSRKQPRAAETAQTVRVWTYEQIRNAIPYIKAVLGSLRECHVEAQAQHSRVARLEAAPGHSDRNRLIALAEARQAERQALDARNQAGEELSALDVFCLTPGRGEAIIPFVHKNQLAWYCFDLFDENPVRFWRYQSDDVDLRRPVEEATDTVTV